MDFSQAVKTFRQLKAQYKTGKLTEQQFKDMLQELMVQDAAGDWWMIGYDTERWYRHDGSSWVQADPPGLSPDESSPGLPPPPKKAAARVPEQQANPAPAPAATPAPKPSPTPVPTPTPTPGRSTSSKLAIGAGLGSVILLGLFGCFMLYNYIANPSATQVPATEPPATEAPATDAPADTSGDQGGIPSTGSEEITFWHADDSSDADNALAALVDQAASDLPDLTIHYQQVPGSDIHDKYLAALQDGTAPDLVFGSNAFLGQDAQDGNVAELSSLGGDWQGDYRSNALIAMSIGDNVYGVPLSLTGIALWYNTDYISDPPADTGDLLDIINEGHPVALPYDCYWDYGFYNAFGGRIFGDGWSVIAGQESGNADALQYLYDLYQRALSSGLPTAYTETSRAFRDGILALTLDGNWNIPDITSALGDKAQVAPLPSGPGGSASPLVGVNGFFINPHSLQQDAAMTLALYLSDQASSETLMQTPGFIPANANVDVSDPIVQGFLDSFESGTAWSHYPQFTRYWNNFCDADQILQGNTTIQDWLTTATSNANQ